MKKFLYGEVKGRTRWTEHLAYYPMTTTTTTTTTEQKNDELRKEGENETKRKCERGFASGN